MKYFWSTVIRIFGGVCPLFRGATLRGREARNLPTLFSGQTNVMIPLATYSRYLFPGMSRLLRYLLHLKYSVVNNNDVRYLIVKYPMLPVPSSNNVR